MDKIKELIIAHRADIYFKYKKKRGINTKRNLTSLNSIIKLAVFRKRL